jgi:alkylation response protein AidB-like acyl-CoA dehydrogenase
VPAENLLGEEGMGFVHLMQNLPQERLSIAIMAAAAMEEVLESTLQYTKERKAFGKPIGSFQNSRFVLAELSTDATLVRIMVDEFIRLHLDETLTAEQAAMAKWYSTEAQVRLVDRCLQLHGGYRYMREYPIARAFMDWRVQTIYGGTTEIMKEIIGLGVWSRPGVAPRSGVAPKLTLRSVSSACRLHSFSVGESVRGRGTARCISSSCRRSG